MYLSCNQLLLNMMSPKYTYVFLTKYRQRIPDNINFKKCKLNLLTKKKILSKNCLFEFYNITMTISENLHNAAKLPDT